MLYKTEWPLDDLADSPVLAHFYFDKHWRKEEMITFTFQEILAYAN